MEYTLQQKIWTKVEEHRQKFNSDRQHAASLGISAAAYSQLKNGNFETASSEKWQSIARIVGYNFNETTEWVVAETPVFQFITGQLQLAKDNSMAGIFVDAAGIGKSYTAREFGKKRNVAYIDCSQCKSKIRFVKALAKTFGYTYNGGTINDLLSGLIDHIKTLDKPLIIMDEAGDLDYGAFLEIKAIYNALEGSCGFYLLGADGLKAKIDRNLNKAKVGYAEIFDRFGGRYQSIMPADLNDRMRFNKQQAMIIAKANGVSDKAELQELIAKDSGLRRIYIDIVKRRTLKAAM